MTLRRGWWACWLLCVACQSVLLSACPGATEPASTGQQTGQEQRPIGFFEPSLASQPEQTRSHLSQAAALLEKGQEAAACEHLGKYLADHPEHFEVRVHFAELLLRQARLGEARGEFARSIAQAQEVGDKTLRQRVQLHSRLMDIAEAEEDDYGLHFHRGVGLYLLALERARLGDPDGTLPVEGLLCRAAGELALARAERSAEARPCWYLHLVWSALGQHAAATRWLERTRMAAPFTHLTPAEQRGLQLTARLREIPIVRP